MTEKKFWKLINEIQTFMWLDNWEITYQIINIEKWNDKNTTDAQCVNILYSYFRAHIDFNTKLMEDDDDYITHVIFHELCHIYTSKWLYTFEDEEEYIKSWIWQTSYVMIKEKMIIVNEQQTELLARRFKELYLKTK